MTKFSAEPAVWYSVKWLGSPSTVDASMRAWTKDVVPTDIASQPEKL